MIKNISKITVLIVFVFSSFIAKAQLGYNFSHYSIGFSGAMNTAMGDAQTQTMTPSVNFNLTYNSSPYTNFVFEAQLGRLAGGDSLKTLSGRQFNNDFSAFIFRGQLQMGELMDYSQSKFKNAIKNFYVSLGIGFVVNNITAVSRNSYLVPGFTTPGEDKSKQPFIPLRIGYEFKIFNSYNEPNVCIDLGYGYNFILGDGLDGYSPTPGHHDAYTQFTLGVKFAIGGDVVSYKKMIPY